jgi:uncharacterized protein YdhG (YjbR/CyaY superfamily)
MNKPKSVDEYIKNAPENLQDRLKEIRKAIKEAAPEALEKLSYSMPYYGYKGRLAYFSYAKSHIGLYIPPPVIEEHQKELKNYSTAKATVRLPNDKELPIALIKRLVKARVKKNDE